jgi:hypothetical protein
VEAAFGEENRLPDAPDIVVSPSGRYRLEVSEYDAGPGAWTYSRGIVTQIDSSVVIAEVKRNYGHFPYVWIDHPDGNEYMLCGEDYQGYTVINLTQGVIQTYMPEEAQTGEGFCWVVMHPAPDGRTLAVEGCFWGAPFEIHFFDFSTPAHFPLAELGGSDADYEDNSIGWETPTVFVMTCKYKIRLSDGARFIDLSPAEQKLLDQERSLAGYKNETVRWQRPPNS